METRIHGLRTLAPLSFRRFAGAIADVWSVRGERNGGGFYIAPDPRIVIFLGDTSPPLALRTGADRTEHRGIQALYVPEGVPLWSRIEAGHEKTHLDFHLQSGGLRQRLAAANLRPDLSRPRLLGPCPTLTGLAQMAADEVRAPRRGDMLIDALFTATLAEIFAPPPQPAPPTGALAQERFAAVEGYLRANLTRHVPVAELARVAGLSESRFAYAFKQLRSETPQRWQARVRLEAARAMLEDPTRALADVAYATGFADQAHLSRAFRAAHGMPPSVWRRQVSGTNPGGTVQDNR
ncbi:helix-turn-helix domain-containing protein [Paenirhodobacter sp.]|uniref:AraC family transcriptional regulator n=1 Tax=Paenirhodobacter sp. TaxID=1965326 RepID=UPI003B3C3DE6